MSMYFQSKQFRKVKKINNFKDQKGVFLGALKQDTVVTDVYQYDKKRLLQMKKYIENGNVLLNHMKKSKDKNMSIKNVEIPKMLTWQDKTRLKNLVEMATCLMCKNIVRKPKTAVVCSVAHCGRMYCNNCYQNEKSHSELVNMKICLACNKPLNKKTKVHQDTIDQIYELEFRCRNPVCLEQENLSVMKYAEYQKHIDFHSKFQPCFCPMGCKKAVTLNDLPQHFNFFQSLEGFTNKLLNRQICGNMKLMCKVCQEKVDQWTYLNHECYLDNAHKEKTKNKADYFIENMLKEQRKKDNFNNPNKDDDLHKINCKYEEGLALKELQENFRYNRITVEKYECLHREYVKQCKLINIEKCIENELLHWGRTEFDDKFIQLKTYQDNKIEMKGKQMMGIKVYDGQAEKDEERKGIGKYTKTFTVANKIMLEIYEGQVDENNYSGWGRLFQANWQKGYGTKFVNHTGWFENNEPSGYGIRYQSGEEEAKKGIWDKDECVEDGPKPEKKPKKEKKVKEPKEPKEEGDEDDEEKEEDAEDDDEEENEDDDEEEEEEMGDEEGNKFNETMYLGFKGDKPIKHKDDVGKGAADDNSDDADTNASPEKSTKSPSKKPAKKGKAKKEKKERPEKQYGGKDSPSMILAEINNQLMGNSQRSTNSQSQSVEKEITTEQKAVAISKQKRTKKKQEKKKSAKAEAKQILEDEAVRQIEFQQMQKAIKKNPVHQKKLTPYEAYKLERIEEIKSNDPLITISKLTKMIYDEWQRVDIDDQQEYIIKAADLNRTIKLQEKMIDEQMRANAVKEAQQAKENVTKALEKKRKVDILDAQKLDKMEKLAHKKQMMLDAKQAMESKLDNRPESKQESQKTEIKPKKKDARGIIPPTVPDLVPIKDSGTSSKASKGKKGSNEKQAITEQATQPNSNDSQEKVNKRPLTANLMFMKIRKLEIRDDQKSFFQKDLPTTNEVQKTVIAEWKKVEAKVKKAYLFSEKDQRQLRESNKFDDLSELQKILQSNKQKVGI